MSLDDVRQSIDRAVKQSGPRLLQMTGATFLAFLATAALLPLLPELGVALPLALSAPILAQIGSIVGGNILADLLKDFWQRLATRPPEYEEELLARLTVALEKEIAARPGLRVEIGQLLETTRAVEVAEKALRGDPQAHGWLLVSLHAEMAAHRAEFSAGLRQLEAVLLPHVAHIRHDLEQAHWERAEQRQLIEEVLAQLAPPLLPTPDQERIYLECLADAYRAFFRERFVHQAMEAMEVPVPFAPESPTDALLVELVALVDEEEPPGYESELPSPRESQTCPIPDLHAGLTEYQTIALLGEPGAGKTSALLWLLGTWPDTAVGDGPDRLPVFVSLSQYNRGTVEDFIADAWAPSLADVLRADEEQRAVLDAAVAPLAASLGDYTARGRTVLLLDALNELPRGEDHRERLTRLRRFVENTVRLGNWVVVSCRQQDYTEALRPLQRVEIRPLDDERIRRFLTVYLGAKAEDALWMTLGESRYARLRELARNPFLLASLVGVHRLEGGALPTARVALLDRLAAASIKWEERKGHPGWVAREEQEKVLAALALAMTTLGRTAVNKAELTGRLPEAWFFDPERREPLLDVVLRLARGARLARWTPGSDGGVVTFEHQLWQAYYTARMAAGLGDPEWQGLSRHITGCDEIATPFDVIRPHLHNSSWRDVVLLASARMDEANASEFIDHILNAASLWEEYLYRDALLTTACLAEGANVRSDVADAALARLKAARRLDIRPLTRRADQTRIAALVTLDRAEELLALSRDAKAWWEVRQAATEALEALGRVDEAIEAWLEMAQDRRLNSRVRQEVAERLERAEQRDAAIKAWSALGKDRRAGKGVRREARRALKRLR